MEIMIIIDIVLTISLIVLTIVTGRYVYQKGFNDGLDEAVRIMAEVRGVRYEDITQDGTKRSI